MAAKSNGEVKEVIARSIADAAKNPGLSKALSENHLKVLSQPPYDLTLEDFIVAHDTHLDLRPAGGGPWGAGQTSDQGPPWGGGQTSGQGRRPRAGGQRITRR
jgi:hypothetical protein